MKLYTSIGPNPHVVRMFMAEAGIELPEETVDIRKGANREANYLAINPAGQSPCLQLDDGSHIAEITAICEYLADRQGGSSLIGSTPEERAETRMWTRRVDLNICEPLASGFRFGEGLKMFQGRMRCLPEASDGLKAIAQDKIAWLDGLMDGKQFLCGDRISLADILLYCFLAFGKQVGQDIAPENANVAAWFERMKARPTSA
ncbi:MAG: glutathione S-transferase family protein [Alphaproteobacteria bacterium]|nr:glutathione S-transferase family protein [Alphaproteobacteria bacterium]MCY4230641.1 glutathione S-transferase family protein [Alphaproteobacteria bacterium]MCY4319190.1 glutathione S-transferase family protein [Alphaproteobacteria bacterium]